MKVMLLSLLATAALLLVGLGISNSHLPARKFCSIKIHELEVNDNILVLLK
jgi:hypothetical protein